MAENSLKSLSHSISNTYSVNGIFGGAFPSAVPLISAEPERRIPRSHQVITGQNIILTPRTEVPGLMPFEILEFVAKSTDLIMIAENIILNQISGRKWDVVPEDPEDKTNYSKEIKLVKSFFKSPDKHRTYSQWLRKLLKNVIRYDALAIYKVPNKRGELYGLQIIDGKTLKILVDSNGNKPLPPTDAYQQIIYGTPRGAWTTDELIYAPMSEEIVGNYGISPVERIIVSALKYLRKQQFDYSYYKEGAYPSGGLFAVKPNDQSQWTVDDIKLFQEDWLTAMAVDSNRQSMKFVPDGSYISTKSYEFNTIQEEWFGRMVSLSTGVPPQLFTKQVNRSVAEVEDRQQTEMGLKPYIKHIEDILTNIIQKDLKFEPLALKIIDEKLEDQNAKVDKNVKYLAAGIYNVAEIRKEEGKDTHPYMEIYTKQVGNAIIPLEDIKKAVTVPANGTDNENNVGSMETETRNLEINNGNRVVSDKSENKKPSKPSEDKSKEKTPEVKKAMGAYKSFLIQRFKRDGNLYGFEHKDLSEDIIKTIEAQLSKVVSLSDIHDIFKSDSEDKKETEKKLYWL